MIALLKSEFYKTKRNGWIWLSWSTGIILAIVFFITSIKEPITEQTYFMGDFFPILMCILVGGIWTIEYSQGTIRDLCETSHRKITIFFAKVVITIVAVLIVFFSWMLLFTLMNGGLKSTNISPCNLLIGYGVLILSQAFILILAAVNLKSFSKIAMVSLIFLILHRVINGMADAGAYSGIASKTFLPLFYGLNGIAINPGVWSGILFYGVAGLACLIAAGTLFIRQED